VPSKTNQDRILELEGLVKTLVERVDNVRQDLGRIESTIEKRTSRLSSSIQAIFIAVVTVALTLVGEFMIKRLF
jgi:hypothetical protein